MPPNSAPRLAMVVANQITGDSRVQKSAITAARDGWEVAIIGRSGSGRLEFSTMGPIQVIRVPVGTLFQQHRARRQGHRFRRMVTQFGLPDKAALTRYRAHHRAWVLRQTAMLDRTDLAATLSRPARKGLVRISETLCDLRGRAWGWEQSRHRHDPATVRPSGDWRRDWPALVDIDIAFIPVIEEWEPDVIHAHDITTIGTAAQAAARMRQRGRTVAWLYDAHEYVRAIEGSSPAQASALQALEREFIGRADAVVTVSGRIAELLRTDHHLPETPTVVGNAPVRQPETCQDDGETPASTGDGNGGGGDGGGSVRRAAGVPDGVPLIVYSGWIAPERGVDTVVRALPAMPDVHLAIVAGRESKELSRLLTLAEQSGVRDRVHITPYVAQHRVPAYLSSADLGLICFRKMWRHEISLPTKLAEYLHAGLPLVCSDLETVREFVERHGVGTIFTADDPASLADAVTRALADRDRLVERITEPLLTELSWEQQSSALPPLYRRIAGRVPSAAKPDVPWTVDEVRPRSADVRCTPSDGNGWRPLGPTPVRLGVGPANYAGQAAGFARAVCAADPRVSAEVFMYRGSASFGYPADVYLDAAKLRDCGLQADQVHRVGRFTHLLADAFRPVLGYLNGEHIGADLPVLARAGLKVALLAHGGEIRHPGRHLERHPCSHFRDAPEGVVERLAQIVERNRRIAEECGLPIFVTTPDLLDDLPWARWAPLVVDVAAWACDRPVMRRPRPIVLHAPSARWTKGTDRILPTLRGLHRRRVIELRLVENLPWEQVHEEVLHADLVVDQFTTGAYGTLSCEAMAAGKPVVAYISDTVRETVGPRLPIVNATPATLGDVLAELLDDPDRTTKIGMESADFAREYHSGQRTAQVLADFLTDGAGQQTAASTAASTAARASGSVQPPSR